MNEIGDAIIMLGMILMGVGLVGLSVVGIIMAFAVSVPLGFLAIAMCGIAALSLGGILSD